MKQGHLLYVLILDAKNLSSTNLRENHTDIEKMLHMYNNIIYVQWIINII